MFSHQKYTQTPKAILLKRMIWIFLSILCIALQASPAYSAFVINYQAPADPTTQGFSSLVGAAPAPQVNEPIADDLGYPAWSISGLGLSSQFVYLTGALSAAQKGDITNHGFNLTLRGRVLQGTAPAYDAGNNALIGGAQVYTGPRQYDLLFGVNSSGNTVAVLPTSIDFSGPGGSLRGVGPSYTLNDAGYHTYELVFNPQTQSASLFIDGIERISGYTGRTTNITNRGLDFGAGSGGGMNFNLVRLASPAVAPVTGTTIDLWQSFPDNQGDNGFFAYGYDPAKNTYRLLSDAGSYSFYRPEEGRWNNPHVFKSGGGNGWLGEPWIGLWPSGTASNTGSPEDAVLAWAVSATGSYQLNGSFYLYPSSCTNGVDAYIKRNNTTIWASYLPSGATQDFAVTNLSFNASDTIYFGVDAHNDNGFSECDDHAFVKGQIQAVQATTQTNLIDATYGAGAGSFELGNFVDGGGNPNSAGPGYMGLLPGDNTTITGWTVGGPGDGVDWFISPIFRADTGVHSVDLQHTSNSSIATVIPTMAGSIYRLSFGAGALSGYDNAGIVSAGSLVSQPFTGALSPTFDTQTFTPIAFLFTATGPTTEIRFTGAGSNVAHGPIIDSVSVVQVSDSSGGTDFLGGAIKTPSSYEFTLEQNTQKNETVQLINPGSVGRSATLEVINPHDDLSVSLTEPNPISIAPGETNSLPLVLDARSTSVGRYDGILLKVTVDDGNILYSNMAVYVTEQGAADLPDLAITSNDISFTGGGDSGEPVILKANIHNRGSLTASNFQVQFFEFDNLLGTTEITQVPTNGIGSASITAPLASGDHLIRVVIDPSGLIPELDESNNQASQVIHLGGSTGPTAGTILVTGSLPSKVYTNSTFTLSGRAIYDLIVNGTRYTNYVVKGGSVQVTVKRNDGGIEATYGNIYTDINGNLSKAIQAPASPGTYRIIMTVSDKTFIGTRELVFSVTEAPSTPQPPPLPPGPTPDTGKWVLVINPADPDDPNWVWVPDPLSGPTPPPNLRVVSDDINFTKNNPDADEAIIVWADIHYWAPSTTLVAKDVPVNVYATYPGGPKTKIGETVIPSLSVGHDSSTVFATWKNQAEGIYLIEFEIDPSFIEQNMLDNAATRAIIVGQLTSGQGQGAVSGQVIDVQGGVGNVTINVFDESGTFIGNAITDPTGFYLVQNVPLGAAEVRIVTPTGYVADAVNKPATVSNESISLLNFQLKQQSPSAPSTPSVPDNGTNVAVTAMLTWTPSALATSYDLYLWKSDEPKPTTPTAAGLISPSYDPQGALLYGTSYSWQIVALNSAGASEGPVWTFSTAPGPNQAPILDPISSQIVNEGQLLTFAVTAHDPDGNTLTLSASDLPPEATFIDNGGGAGSFQWTPDFGMAGNYTVLFKVTDDGTPVQTATQEVTITVGDVNRPPVLDPIGNQVVDEDQLLTFAVTAHDPDGDTLTLSASDLPTGAIFVDNGGGAGSFSWTPGYHQSGSYNVLFKAADNGVPVENASQTITITVGGVNRPPVLDLIGNQVVDEGKMLTFAVTAHDPDGDTLTLSASDLPLGATFVDNGGGAGSFSWTPDYQQAGSYSVLFKATDNGVPVESASQTITITVGGVNRPPVLDPIGNQVVNENQALTFAVTAQDPDGDTLSLSASDLPQGATFVDNGGGAGSFSWTPDYQQAGSYSVLFKTTDNGVPVESASQTITITVGGLNRPPVLDPIGKQVVNESQMLTFAVTAHDPDSDTLALSASGLPTGATFIDDGSGAGVFQWTPDFGLAGSYSVIFQVTDNGTPVETDTETVTIDVKGPQVSQCDLNGNNRFDLRDIVKFALGCRTGNASWQCDYTNDGRFTVRDTIMFVKQCNGGTEQDAARLVNQALN